MCLFSIVIHTKHLFQFFIQPVIRTDFLGYWNEILCPLPLFQIFLLFHIFTPDGTSRNPYLLAGLGQAALYFKIRFFQNLVQS